ncbi:hypothetical protein [Staphylococcus simulans]|uniref:hypothetical protein n=1 Tax=Staphylococcus simulans TaxID=1286 RepID=UPI00130494FB|nr:hypothetical protein [Staphylococcus simulans]
MDIFENIMFTVTGALTFIGFLCVAFIIPMYIQFKNNLITQIKHKMSELGYSSNEIIIRNKYLDKQSISKLERIDQKLQRQIAQKLNNPEDKITEQNFFITPE